MAEDLRALLAQARRTLEEGYRFYILWRRIVKELEGNLKERAKRTLEEATRDPYRILGVDREAPDEVVEAAYKVLMRKYHPDGLEPDPARAKLINWAYDKIKEERRR